MSQNTLLNKKIWNPLKMEAREQTPLFTLRSLRITLQHLKYIYKKTATTKKKPNPEAP